MKTKNINLTKQVAYTLFTIGLVCLVIGVSYAAYTFSGTGTKENIITTGQIEIAFEEQNNISLVNRYPEVDSVGIASNDPNSSMTFTVSGNIIGDATVNYAIGLTDITEGSTLTQDYIKIYLTKNGSVASGWTTGVGQTIGSFESSRIVGYLDSHAIAQGSITGTQVDTYTLKAWIDENYDLPTTDTSSGKVHSSATSSESFSFKIKAVGTDAKLDIIRDTAYALYTSGDTTLTFIRSKEPIEVGDTYNNQTVSAVYTGFEESNYTSASSVPWYSNRTKITKVVVEDKIVPISTAYWFYQMTKCTNMDLLNLNTGNVTSMYSMFQYCISLLELDLSNWDVSKVTTMRNMFNSNPNVGFMKITTIGDVGHWDTSNVTTMRAMFQGCEKFEELDVSNWNMSNVTDMKNMFYGAETLDTLDVSNWNVSRVTDMSYMFSSISENSVMSLNNLDVSNWDVSSVTTMQQMFQGCSNIIELDLSNWDVSSVTTMYAMFYNCNSLTKIGNLDNWDVSSVTTMQAMFNGCKSLTTVGNLSNWDVSSVTTMLGMFNECSSLTAIGNLSNWDVSNVTSMAGLFQHCHKLETIGNIGNWNVSNVTDMSYMFNKCYELESIGDISNWNISSVTTMYQMFSNCSSLITLGDLSSWDVSSVTTMYGMFGNCSSLITLGDLDNWNVSKVTSMVAMFQNCYELETLGNIGGWTTTSLTQMDNMFNDCNKLKSLNLSGFNTSKLVSWTNSEGESRSGMSYAFTGLNSLEEITLGANFAFKEDGYLPEPSKDYITGATGLWYTSDGSSYEPSLIPNNTNQTYYAIPR